MKTDENSTSTNDKKKKLLNKAGIEEMYLNIMNTMHVYQAHSSHHT